MSQLSKVKDFVLKDERRAIKDLRFRSEDRERRAQDLAEVMPRALEIQTDKPSDERALLDALAAPVADSVRDSMKHDPESFADALFPVLGPAIRKAVSEAIRTLAERLNRTVEHSFSRRGIRWRWESIRTGTPMADLILRDTLVYRVEQIFVIERGTGHLLTHVQDAEFEAMQDSDAVSAMLTAIQDFVRDSFGAYEQTDLNTVQIGGRTVWIFYGPELMLAAVFFGTPNAGLRPAFHAANEQVHRLYADESTAERLFKQGTPNPIQQALLPLLTSDSTGITAKNKPNVSRFAKFALLAMIPVLLWIIGSWIADRSYRQKVETIASSLTALPGVVVFEVSHQRYPSRIRMLKDSGVQLPSDEFGLDEARVDFDVYPFQSSAPELLMNKISGALRTPSSVRLQLANGTLVASGTSSETWLEQLRTLPLSWLGIERIDYSELTTHK